MSSYTAARVNDSTLAGRWSQGGRSTPLNLHRLSPTEAAQYAPPRRPQTPVPPFPYHNDSVEYDNAEKTVHLGATLAYPAKGGPFPAAILITGSGTQDRDETIFGHKAFAVIADYLTGRGYAVLRVDDRKAGLSTGDVSRVVTTEDFAKDVETSFAWLKAQKQIDAGRIGLIGHSEGAMIAPMLAARHKDIAFIISLAGPANGRETMIYQTLEPLKQMHASGDYIVYSMALEKIQLNNMLSATDSASFMKGIDGEYRAYLSAVADSTRPNYILSPERYEASLAPQTAMLVLDWWKFLIRYRASDYYSKVKCPVLALGGEKDIQVPNASDLPFIDSTLKEAGNNKVTTHLMPGLNHLFQHCKTCTAAEYGQLEETFSPEALQVMGDWMDKNVKR
jgi:pimeloyl-ACP methyl ester carboxylesterase